MKSYNQLHNKNIGRALMVGTAVMFGLAGVCVKSISWGTMSIVVARSLLTFIMLAVVNRSLKIHFSKWNILGALAMTATGTLYVQSIKLTTAGTAIVLQYVAPVLVFIFAVLFQHRKVKWYEVLLTVLVFGGIVLSFADALDATKVIGNLLGLASGFTYAAQIIIMNRESTQPKDSLMISCLVSLVIALPFAFFDANLSFDFKNVIWVLVLGIFQYGLANVFLQFGIQKVDKIEGALLLTIEPIFNPIPVAIICHERMGWLALLGSAVVIICVTLYSVLPGLIEKVHSAKNEP